MPDRFPPAKSGLFAADGTPESYLEMLLTHPELEDLKPFYIEWEFIWPMQFSGALMEIRQVADIQHMSSFPMERGL
jgi:hypothetical protein